jgi:AcrR family transcriptional regulator
MIDAAERLIADRGIGNVSVRDITSAAGVNTAAVNYHFGTKEGLLEAIVQRHAEQFGARRSQLLHGVAEEDLTLRIVVRALVVATAELAADGEHGGALFLACKQRMRADPWSLSVLERYFEPYTADFLRALKAVTPHLPRPVRVLRFALARDAVDHAFSTDAYPGWIERRVGEMFDHDEYTEQVIDFLVAGFAAPA